MTGRFAPSPSGRMHLGNLWSALLAWLAARSAGGRMVLRLEDLDPDRCTQAWCDQVMRDLEWLGLDWDNEPVYQSRRTARPTEAAFVRQLEEKGLVYPCFCTRAERLAASAPHRSDGQAPCMTGGAGACRRRSGQDLARQPHARPGGLAVPDEVPAPSGTCSREAYPRKTCSRDCGDFILRRSDGVYAYQLAVVVDDGGHGGDPGGAGQRSARLHPAAAVSARSGWACPAPEYGHVPLLLAPDGRRLAKRDRDQELGALQQPFTPPRSWWGSWPMLAGLIPEYGPHLPR